MTGATGTTGMTGTAVITGIGVVAPTGLGTGPYWDATLRAESAIGAISRFDASGYPVGLAAEVPDSELSDGLPSRLLPQTDRVTRLALWAAGAALDDAGVDPAAMPEYGMGVVTANAYGGFEFGHRELENLWARGPQHVSAYQSFAWFYAVNTGQISIRHGMRGPSGVLVSEQAGGIDAVAHARRHVRKGIPLVITGGVDSAVCPWGWVAQLAHGRLSRDAEPAGAYLPFAADASGHVAGEGGAIFVLEDAGSARERGAASYGTVVGYAATFDPPPDSGREPGLRRAVEQALADAGAAPGDVDVVFADAAGSPDLDLIEADALRAVFGPYGVPVTAPKAGIGRLASGGAAVDLAAALLAIREGAIPPTANVAAPAAGYEIDLVVGAPRAARVRTALVVARGHGGFNAAMLVRGPELPDGPRQTRQTSDK